MAPGDVCHGPRCSLTGLGPAALEYRSCHWPGGSAGSPQCVRPMGCWFFPVPRPPYVCAVSWATELLFTGVPAWFVALHLQCPGQLGSCSPVRPLGLLCCVCGVLGHLAPIHRCARRVCCVVCAVSWATWLLFTGAPARCVALCVRCPGPLGTCSPVCPRGLLCCVCGVLGHLAPVHRCARRFVLLRVRCPGPLGSCSPVRPVGVLCCVCGVLGHLAPVDRRARWVCCVACAVSWATWLPLTGVPVPSFALLLRCPGPRGSCSPVCPLDVLCCVCGVLGHLAPVHRCARWVRRVACAVSWATWLLFTGVLARCVALRVRCPGPLGSCSPVCPLGVLFCMCGALGHVAPLHRCARSVCCFARAVSWATWLLFTGVPARCVVLRVRCPGPLGSCSPVCPLGVGCCVSGVLGHLAPVQRCARSVLCFACAVSWATWLLFNGVSAPSLALLVRCPGPLGSCSPVCTLRPLLCLCGVLGHVAPVHRCARSVGCVARAVSWAPWLLFTSVPARWVVLQVRCPGPLGSCPPVCSLCVLCFGLRVRCCVCGASLRGAHSSIQTGAVRSRQGLGTLRAPTRPSGRRLFVAGRGWVPSGRALVHPDGGWCCLVPVRVPLFVACCARSPGLRHPAAGVAWHLSVCLGCGWRRASLACLVAPRGAPRLVRSGRSRCSGRLFPTPWCLSPSRGLAPPPLLGGCAGHAEAGREPGSLCLPLAPAEAGALGSLCVVPVRGSAMALSLAGPSGVGLGLRALRWVACVDPVTDPSGFPYRPSFDGGLGRCTGAFLCGRRHLPLRVGGRHARVPCVCACVRPSWPGRAGRPPGRVLVRLTFSFGRFVFLLLGPLQAGVAPFLVRFFFLVVFCAPPLSLAFFGFWPRVPWALAPCFPFLPLPPACFFFCLPSFCAPVISGFLWFPALGALGLGAVCCLFCWPLASRLSVRSRLVCVSCPTVGCSLVVAAPPPPSPTLLCLVVSVAAARCLVFFFLPFPFCAPVVSAFSVFRPRVPRALALCVVCFVGLPLLGSPCALASFVFPAWPLVALWWLLPPPPPLCFAVFVAAAWCPVCFFLSLCAPVVFGFLRFPAPGALGLGAVCCLLCWPPASRLSVRSGLFCVSRPAVGCSLVAAAPPPPPVWCLAVFVAAASCCAPCAVLCCAVCPWVRCCTALRRVVLSGVVLLCAMLFCCARFGCAACCAAPCGAALRPWALCFAALCFAVFPRALCSVLCVFCCGVLVHAVVRRCALCCVSPGVSCCALPVLSALCGAVLRCAGALALCCSCGVCCCWRLVLWCAAVCCAVSFGVLWCGAGFGGPWLSAGGVFRCRCACLAAWSASLWLLWFAVVPCLPVSCSVVLCCRVVLCCCALLSFCGVVGACFALLWPVMLCCVALLVVCAVFFPVVVSACCGPLFLPAGTHEKL